MDRCREHHAPALPLHATVDGDRPLNTAEVESRRTLRAPPHSSEERGPSRQPSIPHAPCVFACRCCTTSSALATCSGGVTLLMTLTILPSRAMTKVVLSANPWPISTPRTSLIPGGPW